MCASRPHPWTLRCSAAACGVPLVMTWTKSWSTVCYPSSTLGTGSLSLMLGPTVWVSHSAPPLTHPRRLFTMSSPQETGKKLCGVHHHGFSLQEMWNAFDFSFLHQVRDAGHVCHPWSSTEELLVDPLFSQFLPNRGCTFCPSLAIIGPGRLLTFLLVCAASFLCSTFHWDQLKQQCAWNFWDQTELISQTPV